MQFRNCSFTLPCNFAECIYQLRHGEVVIVQYQNVVQSLEKL